MSYVPEPCICGGKMRDLLSFQKGTQVFTCEHIDFIRVETESPDIIWYQYMDADDITKAKLKQEASQ